MGKTNKTNADFPIGTSVRYSYPEECVFDSEFTVPKSFIGVVIEKPDHWPEPSGLPRDQYVYVTTENVASGSQTRCITVSAIQETIKPPLYESKYQVGKSQHHKKTRVMAPLKMGAPDRNHWWRNKLP